ncbi:Rhs-family protein [Alloactinosynnema sp. L-07]|uniref:RHS repeat-associated core domain-containing protein n=1 Tax=Alloactinosynnema sp. L-07 TaxID=1653480 RepID=UPI00065F027C|nr:RHS repeat-associated core domain-containing protein [Alloactinosynnema sp. L-07]CRK58287.1 Rhs-family protein [Alloactinosynnema sp. L-07]
MTNPLIAAPKSDTTAFTGIGIAESAQGLADGVSNGDWVEAGLGAVGVGLEVLSMVIDPIGTVASYGVSWLIEHVEPLKEALDWFAGDPPVIRSFSETWANIAAEVGKVAGDLGTEATTGTPGWQGPAADAYRGNAAETADAISGAGALADGIGAGVMIMGEVVAAVRELIRDLVAEVVGKLITWALEAVATLGLATPLIVAQATSTIAKVTNRIADLVRKLVKTIGNVTPRIRKVIDKLGEIMEKLGKLGRRTDGGPGTSPSSTPNTPKADTPTVRDPDAPTSPSSTSPDGTNPSGTTNPSGSTAPNGTSPNSTDSPNRPTDPNDTKTPETDRVCENDPIDVVSGDMVLANIDVDLPGVLPLVLRRTHVSSYRAGRSFGSSWASTVDQRLEFDPRGVVFLAEDGMVLVYPRLPAEGSVLPEVGPRWPLSRTENGFVIEPRGTGQSLHFPAADKVSHLAAIVDRNANRIDFARDVAGNLTGVRHSGGYHLDALSERGRITELRMRVDGGHVPVIRYRHDDNGRLTEVVNSSDRPLRFDYDHAGRITQWTDRNGEWYRYLYDAQGRCVANEGSGGFLNGTFIYGDDTTRFTDALGNATTYRFGENRKVIAETDALGHTVTQQWDDADRLVARTDALGNTTKFTYDDAGNLVATTRPDGVQALAEYDTYGQVVAFVGPDGAVWRQEFDERGNLVAETDPTGAVNRYEHDERGHRVAVTDALGGVRRIETNAAGIPLAVTDPTGATTRYTRDAFGRAAVITDPLGGRVQYSWTVEGRMLARTRPDGATERWRYDAEGNAFEHVDPMGRVTRTQTTHFNLPAAEVRPDGTRLAFGYDPTLRLTSVTNAQGLVWRYEYDAAGNLVRETDFNGRVLTYQHDAAGRLVGRVNGAGQATTFARDALGKIVERRSGEQVTTIEYDLVGRVRRARNADADLVYTRDPLGRVLAESVNGRTVNSGYDPLGRRVRRRTPTGAESTWGYDEGSRPVRLTVGERSMSFDYDQAGHEISRSLGNGAVLDQAWDANHRLVSQSTRAEGRDPRRRGYHYQPDDHLTAVDDQLGRSRRYQLDPMGRVTGVEGAGWREQYAYDAGGNVAAPDTEYGGTLVRTAGDARYEHDAQGRVVLRQRKRLSRKPDTWRYQWDADDRLIAVITPDGSRWSYRYDPLGRRIAKLRLAPDGSVAERVDFAWDGSVMVEQTHSAGRTTTWEFDPASFRPLTQTERVPSGQDWVDQRFYAIVTDIVGTPSELLDDQGDPAWRQESTLWGQALGALTQRADTPLRFPGQYFDAETGLHYNYLRYYDPVAARYTSPDPLGLLGGPSPHGYVHNPTGWTDALGLTESGDIEFLDPNDINFSQRTVTENDYADAMRNGQWEWDRSPVHVMEVDGQLVSYDNRRLDAAREAGVPVCVQRVDPNAPHPDSSTGKTWAEKFQERFRDPRNRLNGEPVPNTGLSERPTATPPGCGGGRRRRRR